jgi:regulator of sigma E protease
MELLTTVYENVAFYILPFICALSVLIFIHEYGHYIVARWNGVKVTTFSIGIGYELFGWNDKHGTRWRVAAIPIGGYVKMHGDLDPASATQKALADIPPQERPYSFATKKLWQKSLIVFAGPLANFLLAIVALFFVYLIDGERFAPAQVQSVLPNTPAYEAGIKGKDKIIAINGKEIDRFRDISVHTQLYPNDEMVLTIDRNGEVFDLNITPEVIDKENNRSRIGIISPIMQDNSLSVADSLTKAIIKPYEMIVHSLKALEQVIVGERDFKQLGGPIRIFEVTGNVVEKNGLREYIILIAFLSVNLGLINLFPIPVLDGGHLLFYGMQALNLGRPLPAIMYNIGNYIGLLAIIMLFVAVTYNDLVRVLSRYFDMSFIENIVNWLF